MKKFLLDCLYVLLTIVLISATIECLLLLKPNEYSYKRKYVETHINDIECLLLGNSHIVFAIHPDSLGDNCFNMATVGRDIKYDLALAKRYVPEMDNLDALIIPLEYSLFILGRGEPNTLNQNKPLHRQSTYKCMHYKYMGIRLDGFWYWSEFLNSKFDFLHRFFLKDEDAIECDALGFRAQKITDRQSDWEYRYLPPITNMTKEKDETIYAYLNSVFSTFAELAASKNARLIILFTPMYTTYQQCMDDSVLDEINFFVDNFKAYFQNVEYYDYSHDKRFTEDDFWDASHLSDIGAMKFSHILKEEVFKI